VNVQIFNYKSQTQTKNATQNDIELTFFRMDYVHVVDLTFNVKSISISYTKMTEGK